MKVDKKNKLWIQEFHTVLLVLVQQLLLNKEEEAKETAEEEAACGLKTKLFRRKCTT